MKEEKNKKKNIKKAGVFLGVLTGVIAVVVIMANVSDTIEKGNLTKVEKKYHLIQEITPVAAEADPGAGNSGILEIYIYPHSGDPGTTYAENTTGTLEAAALGYCNADDSEVENIPYSTTFDVVVRVRGNDTHCKRDGTWFDTDLRVRWTCAGLSVGADTEMTGVISANDSGYDFLYMNFYDTNSGSGYTISKDQTVEITSIKFEAYF